MDPFLNATIGEYRVTALLGEGGMGRVYRAQHHRLGRDAAVKVLTTAANDPVFLQRFLNEAQIQSRLRDPGIASLYDFTDFGGAPVMIMEFIDGETLGEITARLGSWDPAQAIPVLSECARTLGYVHSQGIIHRDLKSANVKISSEGKLKLLDFGIAIPTPGETVQRLTIAGFVIGTFQSLAPEQVRGESASQASDLWAFGVLAYEMLTGSLPFEAGNAAELFGKISRAHFTSPSILKPGIPKALDNIVCRCLKREPRERYGSFTELRADLDKLQTHRRELSEPAPSATVQATPAPWRPWVIAAALLLVLAAGWVGAYEHLHAAPVADPQPNLPIQSDGNTRALPTQDQPVPGTLSQTLNQPSMEPTPAPGSVKKVEINVLEGTAEVWRNGQRLGSTPYTVQEPFGRSVQVTLRQSGFRDMPVQFDVTERTSYSFEMQRSSLP